MSESIYLILGTAEDKKRSSVILNEVSNAIYTVGIGCDNQSCGKSHTTTNKHYANRNCRRWR